MPSARSAAASKRGPSGQGGALTLALALLLGACSSAGPGPARDPEEPRITRSQARERPFLLDPVDGYPRRLSEPLAEQARRAHAILVTEGPTEAALAIARAREILRSEPDYLPAEILSAQVDAIAGRWREVSQRLEPIHGLLPAYPAATLLLARAREKLQEVPEAFALYYAYAQSENEGRQAAADRADALRPRALEITFNRLDESIARGRMDLAEGHLEVLESWSPEALETDEARLAVAVAVGDGERELLALRNLTPTQPDRIDRLSRRAELEAELGDASAGLSILEELIAQDPGNPGLLDKLAAAKFRWRLGLLPENVQTVALEPALSRSSFAVLVYWLVPDVRYARPGRARIASDILDHPDREPIARVVNLGLMSVDRTLHRFAPDRPVSRGAALSALLASLGDGADAPTCLSGLKVGPDSHPQTVCEAAARCGVIPSAADCLWEAPLSGSETVELIRRALHTRGDG